MSVHGFDDHIGWQQGDGSGFTANVENGRSRPRRFAEAAVGEVCEKFNPGLRMTGHQSLIFTDIERPRLAAC